MSEGKKFEVRKTPKKRFEISHEGGGRRFEVRGESQNTPLTWHQQKNASDCGPCMILNVLQQMPGVRHAPGTVQEIRRDVNRLRREANMTELGPLGWFRSDDIGEYLSKIAGLNVEEFACTAETAQEDLRAIQQSIAQRPFEFVYSTAGQHFRAVVPSENGYELFDSLNAGPERAPAESVNEMAAQVVTATSQARLERFGIVRQGEATYTTRAR